MQSESLDEWRPELTGQPTPPRQRPLSPTEQQLLASQVAEWLRQGVIEPRRTRHVVNNNLVFVAKKDRTVRVCIDCTPVNAVTKELAWPLTRLQDLRFRLRGAKYFTRIDLKAAFFRIKVPKEYRPYTAFTSGGVQYQFKKMPFGVTTGPSTFQKFMDHKLARYLEWLLVYIDDILIPAETLSELRTRTNTVLSRLRAMGTEINQDKSEYEKKTLIFAGIRLRTEGVGPNVEKVREVLALPFPTTKAEMQSALGLVSYLRDFVPLVSHFTASLYPGQGEYDETRARETWPTLLRHLGSAVTSLRHWDDAADCDLYADASQSALGVVLIQNRKVVALAARKLTPAETRYSATDREHLALLFAAKKFRYFLHRPDGLTRVYSDHQALIGKRSTDMTPRQARWAYIVNQWMPNVCHVKGKDNPADYVSRWGLEIEGGVEKL